MLLLISAVKNRTYFQNNPLRILSVLLWTFVRYETSKNGIKDIIERPTKIEAPEDSKSTKNLSVKVFGAFGIP